MHPIPNNLEVRAQHNGKRFVLSIGVEGESEGNGWREWKTFLDCGGHSEKKQNAAKALLEALAAKDAEIAKWKRRYESESGELRKEMEKAARLESAIAAKDAEIARLRKYLFSLQWKPEDYTDDGECQSVEIKPYTDFKRHDVGQLIKCCDARFEGAKKRAQAKAARLESANAALVVALEDARQTIATNKHHIEVDRLRESEGRRTSDPWEGVPEVLAERLDRIDAALKEAGVRE